MSSRPMQAACRPAQGLINGDLSWPRRLARGDIGLVDLNERVVAEALDVGAIVALPRLVAGVFAKAILDRLESRDFGWQPLLDLEDVPARLRRDGADNRSGRGVEDGFIEVGQQLSTGHLAQFCAHIMSP